MKVTNVSNGPRGFYVAGEVVFLEAGQTSEDVELDTGEVASAKSTGYFEFDGEASASDDGSADGYAVRTKSPGWFVITKDGADVTKSLRKDDLAEFDEMSDEDKAAFVELNSAED